MSGVTSPLLAQQLAPRAMEVRPFGHRRGPNPARRWWTPWRERFTWNPAEYDGRPVRMTYMGGHLRSDHAVEWEFVDRWRIEGLYLYASGERIAWVQIDNRHLLPYDKLYVEQVRFSVS